MEGVMIAQYQELYVALLARSRLEAEGLRVTLLDVETVTAQPFLSPALGGIKLVVHADDVERARAILENPADDA